MSLFNRTSHFIDNLTHAGNTPGFPNQFRYNEMPKKYPTQSQREYVDIRVDGAPVIQQPGQKPGQVNGRYQSLVYDVPFDHSYQEAQKKWLNSTHMAAILVGILFLISRNRS